MGGVIRVLALFLLMAVAVSCGCGTSTTAWNHEKVQSESSASTISHTQEADRSKDCLGDAIRQAAKTAHEHGLTPADCEPVMVEGMRITFTNANGQMTITGGKGFERRYTWAGDTRTVVMIPRKKRWYGSLGMYNPGRTSPGKLSPGKNMTGSSVTWSRKDKGTSPTLRTRSGGFRNGERTCPTFTTTQGWLSAWRRAFLRPRWQGKGLRVHFQLMFGKSTSTARSQRSSMAHGTTQLGSTIHRRIACRPSGLQPHLWIMIIRTFVPAP